MTQPSKRHQMSKCYNDGFPQIDFNHYLEMSTNPNFEFTNMKSINDQINKDHNQFEQTYVSLINVSTRMMTKQGQPSFYKFGQALQNRTKGMKYEDQMSIKQVSKIDHQKKFNFVGKRKIFNFQNIYKQQQVLEKSTSIIKEKLKFNMKEIEMINDKKQILDFHDYEQGDEVQQMLKPVPFKNQIQQHSIQILQRFIQINLLQNVNRLQCMMFSENDINCQINYIYDLSLKKNQRPSLIPIDGSKMQQKQILWLAQGGFNRKDLRQKHKQHAQVKRINMIYQRDIDLQQKLNDIKQTINQIKRRKIQKRNKVYATNSCQTQQNKKTVQQYDIIRIQIKPIIDKIKYFLEIKDSETLKGINRQVLVEAIHQKINNQLSKLLYYLISNLKQINLADFMIFEDANSVQHFIVNHLNKNMQTLFGESFDNKETKIEIFCHYLELKVQIEKEKKQFLKKKGNKVNIKNQQNIINQSQSVNKRRQPLYRTPKKPEFKMNSSVQINTSPLKGTLKTSINKQSTLSTKYNTRSKFNASNSIHVSSFDPIFQRSINRDDFKKKKERSIERKIDQLFVSNGKTPKKKSRSPSPWK